MQLELQTEDLMLAVNRFAPDSGLNVSVDSLLHITLNVKGVPVALGMSIKPLDGSLELRIRTASAAGLGMFGVVRTIANSQILSRCQGIPLLKGWRNKAGNLQFSLPDVNITGASIENGTVILSGVI